MLSMKDTRCVYIHLIYDIHTYDITNLLYSRLERHCKAVVYSFDSFKRRTSFLRIGSSPMYKNATTEQTASRAAPIKHNTIQPFFTWS